MQKGYFRSVPDEREPYTIVIPPPNVTGVLHMGHMLNNTLQDVMIRRARMLGKNACWVPGTDHASIATEAKVVQMLREKGIKKSDLSREDFLKHAWEWKEKYGGIILDQLKKLGASCDWDRTRFTMEEDMSEAVIDVFIDLYKKGYIYRGMRMVNWDPAGLTAVSDEEVIHKEVQSKLTYVQYVIVDADEVFDANDKASVQKKIDAKSTITIATVRPETILGDTAVCVHPDDPRYAHLKGKFAIIPMVNRKVPIIFDDYILIEFGTGALKVTGTSKLNTPAGNINLANPDNAFGDKVDVKTSGKLSLSSSGSLTLGTVDVAGDTLLQSQGKLDLGTGSFNGKLKANSGGFEITQTGKLNFFGDTDFDAGSAKIDLFNPTNQWRGAILFKGGTILINHPVLMNSVSGF